MNYNIDSKSENAQTHLLSVSQIIIMSVIAIMINIFCDMQYRLGLFGFITHIELMPVFTILAISSLFFGLAFGFIYPSAGLFFYLLPFIFDGITIIIYQTLPIATRIQINGIFEPIWFILILLFSLLLVYRLHKSRLPASCLTIFITLYSIFVIIDLTLTISLRTLG